MKRAEITGITEGSCAACAGIREHDVLLRIDGREVHDIIDYLYLSSSDRLKVDIERDGRPLEFTIHKSEEEALGLGFESEIFDGLKVCRNKCPFCFVDQVPPAMRTTLALKDDDYRLSFLHGNFISLTNLQEQDLQKIREYRLSPLYISVHATNPLLRARIFGNKEAAHLMEALSKFHEWGITVHAQIVLCPGINDGAELERTIGDLARFYPSVASVAIVPVGVTKYLDGGSPVHAMNLSQMREILTMSAQWRKSFLSRYGDPLIYLSDEFFLKSGTEIPPGKYYGEFPQIENGVGISRKFITGYNRSKRHHPLRVGHTISAVTGVISAPLIQFVAAEVNRAGGLSIRVHIVENTFWGSTVDVTGLLTGGDILRTLREQGAGDIVFIPSVCLKDDFLFLDDMTVKDLEGALHTKVLPVRPCYQDFRSSMMKISTNGNLSRRT